MQDLEERKEYTTAGIFTVVDSSFYRWEDPGPERLWNLLEITQRVSVRPRLVPQFNILLTSVQLTQVFVV